MKDMKQNLEHWTDVGFPLRLQLRRMTFLVIPAACRASVFPLSVTYSSEKPLIWFKRNNCRVYLLLQILGKDIPFSPHLKVLFVHKPTWKTILNFFWKSPLVDSANVSKKRLPFQKKTSTKIYIFQDLDKASLSMSLIYTCMVLYFGDTQGDHLCKLKTARGSKLSLWGPHNLFR